VVAFSTAYGFWDSAEVPYESGKNYRGRSVTKLAELAIE
jgi:hypothetical protein